MVARRSLFARSPRVTRWSCCGSIPLRRSCAGGTLPRRTFHGTSPSRPAIAGLIQYSEESEPKYRHAEIDLFLDPALHGRGYGSEAVRRVVGLLIDERGHHRITIDPAVENIAAIRAYEKVGFKPVGVMRQAERDSDGRGWHDALLMELLAGEEQ